ncbi:hypothetical protein F5148DRAFT_428608 [Russula earlei]|uniref:Uncharacterized protein n=1 Tax=Russula earlei TaxID=71964 RepID=A0ACC0TZ85_9AGAM|nr:hypothetical protein F5148DRAFT_428608 [Russula earlei]
MRTSGSVLVLALFCLAVGIAPLFAHASAIRFDKRGWFLGFGNSDKNKEKKALKTQAKSITRQVAEQGSMLDSALALSHIEGRTLGPNAAADRLRKKFETHHEFVSKKLEEAEKVHKENPTHASMTALVTTRAAKANSGTFLAIYNQHAG